MLNFIKSFYDSIEKRMYFFSFKLFILITNITFSNVKQDLHCWNKPKLFKIYYLLVYSQYFLLVLYTEFLHSCSWISWFYKFSFSFCPCQVLPYKINSVLELSGERCVLFFYFVFSTLFSIRSKCLLFECLIKLAYKTVRIWCLNLVKVFNYWLNFLHFIFQLQFIFTIILY